MSNNGFIGRVVKEIIAGVRSGLTRFSGPSRVAAIYQVNPGEEVYICDPLNLLSLSRNSLQFCAFSSRTRIKETYSTKAK